MSLNSLAYAEVLNLRRREREENAKDFAPATNDVANDMENALSALVEYLPAETISLYLASISALPALTAADLSFTSAGIYWGFAAATPILFVLVYAGKRHAANLPRFPSQLAAWPWWSTIAATLAFLAWGLAVPGGPYLDDQSGRVVSGLAAMFVSAGLGVVGRLFQKP